MLVSPDFVTNVHYNALRITYKSTANKAVMNRIVREVKGLNPEFKTEHIEGT